MNQNKNEQTENNKDIDRETSVMRSYKDSVFRKLFNDREKAIELYNVRSAHSSSRVAPFAVRFASPGKPGVKRQRHLRHRLRAGHAAGLQYHRGGHLQDHQERPGLHHRGSLHRARGAPTFVPLTPPVALLLSLSVLPSQAKPGAKRQSSINKNMAIRDLIYFAATIQKMIGNKDIYKESAMEIPRPSFIVLYNGTRDMPDMEELRLSDNFMGEDGEISLQLVVKVYNINNGRNAELLERCRTLKEYSRFVEIVRGRAEEGPLTDTVMQEVFDYCQAEGILSEFLHEYGMEVINMLFKELTEEEAREMSRQDGIELGEKLGMAKGLAMGIIDLLSELGDVPDDMKKNIFAQSDLEILKRWHKLASKAESLEEFQNHMS